MQVAPFLHCPTQSSISFAQVEPLQPSKHVHENAPGVFIHDSALIHGPNVDDGFDSHSFTSNLAQLRISSVDSFKSVNNFRKFYHFDINHPSIQLDIHNENHQQDQYMYHHVHMDHLNIHQCLQKQMFQIVKFISIFENYDTKKKN